MKRFISLFAVSLMLTCFSGCSNNVNEIVYETTKIISDAIYGEPDFYDVMYIPDDVSQESDSENKEPSSPSSEESITDKIYVDNVSEQDVSELPSTEEYTIDIDGSYTTADEVALYIYTYDKLPDNFITKSEARELGWNGGGLDKFAPGMCIGGDKFGNYEELLPVKKGRTYTECDIDTLGKSNRGAKRIVFSNDGLIFYTEDHYESFIQLYDENGEVDR